jgi:hypothetical protein
MKFTYLISPATNVSRLRSGFRQRNYGIMERWSFLEDRFEANAPAHWNRPVKSWFEQQGLATAAEPNLPHYSEWFRGQDGERSNQSVRATVNPARVLSVEVTMTPTVGSTNLTFVEIRIVASPASDCIHLRGNV